MWLLPLPVSLPAVTRREVTAQQPNFRGKASVAAPNTIRHPLFSFLSSLLFFSPADSLYKLSQPWNIANNYVGEHKWSMQNAAEKLEKTKSEWVCFPLASLILIKTAWKTFSIFYFFCILLFNVIFFYYLIISLFIICLFYQLYHLFWWFGLSELPVLFWKSCIPNHKLP